MINFSIIVAIDQNNGIGKNGGLPWHLPGDLKHFKNITTKSDNPGKINAVIMGRKTWESLPEKFRPLPNRLNIVLTRDSKYSLPDSVIKAASFAQVMEYLKMKQEGELQKVPEDNPQKRAVPLIGDIFVIGGQQIFEVALKVAQCRRLYCTHILADFQCDTFFPDFGRDFELIESSPQITEGSIPYYFSLYQRKSVPCI